MTSPITTLPDDHPIFEACVNGEIETVRKFLDGGVSLYADSENRASIIAHVRASKSYELFKLFIDRGYDPNHVAGAFNKTELFFAAAMEDIRWLKLLIEHGGNVNHRSGYGFTPYHVAAAVGSKEHIDLMKQAGADTTMLDDRGEDDFMKAVVAGNFWYAEELLKEGRDINRKDATSMTVLTRCAKSGMFEHVKWLLDHGADVHAKDIRDRTALFYAETNKHDRVAELLRQHGAA